MTQRPDVVTEPTSPTAGDPVVVAASEVIGGPVGRYAAPLARGWKWSAAALAGASAITSALAVVLRIPCISFGWSSPDQFWHACFSDLPATYRDANLSAGLGAYLQGSFGAPAPAQPPLTSFVMTLLASLVPSGEIADRTRFYFALWSVVAAVLLALTVWWTAGSVRRHPMRAAVVAFSPVAVLVLVVSPDIVGVALTAAGLYAWSRRLLVPAGILLGLAVSARTYPLVVLLALLLVCLRAGRVRAWVITAGTAAVTAGGLLAVLATVNGPAAGAAYAAWWSSGAGFGSPWLLPQLAGHPLPTGVVTGLAVLGWIAAVVVGAIFALSLPRRPGVAEVSLVMLVVVMLTGKSMTVQSALWLLPLVALVGLAWADVLAWSLAEALHWEATWLYLALAAQPSRGLPAGWYATFLLVRLGGVAWLLARTWQLARSRPPVRDEEGNIVESVWGDRESDELAGPVRGAEDQLLVRFG